MFRHALYIPPLEKVRVVFLARQLGARSEVAARFECLTCELPMEWKPQEQYWACPECEYEMTRKEARVLHVLMADALNDLVGVERSWLWALGNWLLKRLGRPKKPPLLTSRN